MTIPHLQQQIEFLTSCRDHGAENMEWRVRTSIGIGPGGWTSYVRANEDVPTWSIEHTYEFRVRPRTLVIPRAEIPDEYPDGSWTVRLSVLDAGAWHTIPLKRYRTKEDRDAVVAAMLAREEE